MGRRYRKTRRGRGLILKLSVFFLIVCVGAILHIKYNVHPVIRTISEETARAMMNEAVNEAAALVMEGGDSYADIIDMQKNDAGDIVLISADPVAVNDLARSIALLAQTKILQSGEQGFDVPWGTLSGITFLSGKGGGGAFPGHSGRIGVHALCFDVSVHGNQPDAAPHIPEYRRAAQRRHSRVWTLR